MSGTTPHEAAAMPLLRDVNTAQSEVVVSGRRLHVTAMGLACCALETADALVALDDGGTAPHRVVEAADTAEPIHVLVVAGTISRAIAPVVDQVWHELPEPKYAVSFGACTISGGPYWDSYAVLPGLQGRLGPVVEIPGCPPRADQLLPALQLLVERLADQP